MGRCKSMGLHWDTKTKLQIRVLLLAAMLGLSSCLGAGEEELLDDAFSPPVVDPSPNDREPLEPNCSSETFFQPAAQVSKKIDLLFVVDTSGSLDAERTAIAEGIDSFVAALPSDVNFQAAVLLAHGPKSSHMGNLYRYSSNDYVLSSEVLSTSDIREQLRQNMKYTAGDNDTDGGELGLYSLQQAITTNLAANRAKGFFRDDAALAVVFVADENDICSWDRAPNGVTFVNDPNNKEIPANTKYCGSLTYTGLVSELQSLQESRPLLVSGIIYTDPDTAPAGGENEIGYGYMEVINEANGLMIDLASGDYTTGLEDIGYLAVQKLELNTEFNLSQSGFDQSSLHVEVDTVEVPFTYNAGLNQVQLSKLDAGSALSEVYVSYCMPVVDPVNIFNVQFVEITKASAVITWETDQPATAQIRYTNFLTGETLETDLINNGSQTHGFAISGLSSNTLYDVELISTAEGDNNSARVTARFRTLR